MSGEGRQVVGHTGILMGMELGIRLTDAIVSVILARYLMPEGFGLLAFGISYGSLFSIIPGAGMGAKVTRDTAKNPRDIGPVISTGIAAKLILCAVTFVLMWSVAKLSGFPQHKINVVLVGSLLMMSETVLRFFLSFLQGMRRMWTVAIWNLSVRFGWLVLSLTIMAFGGGILSLLWVRVLVTASGMLAALLYLHFKVQKVPFSFDPKAAVRMVKQSFPFALFRLRGTVYTDLGTVLISVLAGDQLTGWYASAHKVLRVLNFIPVSFSGALLPTLSKLADERPKDAAWTLNRSLRYLLIIGLPVSAGISVLAPQFIATLYGPGYEGAADVLRILIFMIPFSFQNGSLLAGMGSVNKERQAGWVMIGGAAFLAVTSLAGIPRFGHYGAAFSALSAEIFILLLQARFLKVSLPSFHLFDVKPGIWAASAAMAGCAWLLRDLNWVLALALSFLVYVGLVLATGVIARKDWESMLKLFKKKQAAVAAAEAEAESQ